MPGPRLSEKELKRRLDTFHKHGRNGSVASQELGISRATLMSSLDRAIREGMATQEQIYATATDPDTGAEVELPVFPDEDVPIENIIGQMSARFAKRLESHAAHTWFPVTVKENKPIAVMWFGDPHVDDNGCNWPVLQRHAELCRTVPGIYGANIGDTTNNWAGRLVKLYANQDTSVKTARRLAEWFMLKSGVRWLVFLIGNHDQWGDGSEILARMGKQFGTRPIVCHDWEARFHLSFPNGWKPRIYAAHNFPGHSQWNPLHGIMKEGLMGDEADLYVAGDKHNWALSSFENPSRGRMQHFVRVRGFKFMDDHARNLGKKEQETGCSILTVFDPADRSILCFQDVEKGTDYLTKLRSDAT